MYYYELPKDEVLENFIEKVTDDFESSGCYDVNFYEEDDFLMLEFAIDNVTRWDHHFIIEVLDNVETESFKALVETGSDSEKAEFLYDRINYKLYDLFCDFDNNQDDFIEMCLESRDTVRGIPHARKLVETAEEISEALGDLYSLSEYWLDELEEELEEE